MPDIKKEVEFEVCVYCDTCGFNLEDNVNVEINHYGDPVINVEPCPECIKNQEDK